MDGYLGKDTPKLGFGLMRLPRRGPATDIEQVKRMVDLFMDAGGTYFDTAHVYVGSEVAARKALVERHPRESFTLATKLYAPLARNEASARKQFATSLERTGAGYFDYYLLHSLMANNYRKYDKLHLWDFVREQKERGLVRHYGFSYHSGPELLDRILDEHPDAEFVQLQINYADWERSTVTARANYEVARRHGKPVVVMEPVKGGKLANPPAEAARLMKDCRPELSCASWAIRFAASLDGVITVLSGMSNVAQMEDNLSYMRDFRPLDDEEQKVIQQVQRIMGDSRTIDCTACRYCVEGCPAGIAIPEVIAAMNKQLGNGQAAQAREAYTAAVAAAGRASDCIECGACEDTCPQHLRIPSLMGQAAGMFEQ